MTWASEYLDDFDLIAAFNADKPILVGLQALEGALVPAKWRDANLGLALVDFSAAGYEAYYATDRSAAQRSRPVEGLAEWNLVFEIGANADDDLELDVLAIIDHNLASAPGVQVSADVADDNAISVGVTPILGAFTPNPGRHVAWFLGDDSTPMLFTGRGYGRLRITGPSGFVPEIGELWIGRRRQLQRWANKPADEDALGSAVAAAGGEFASETVHALYRGRSVLSLSFTPTEDDAEAIRAWYRDCGHGTKPFLWCARPNSAPHATGIYLGRPNLVLPLVGPVERTWTIEADEQPPFMTAPVEVYVPPPYVNTGSLFRTTAGLIPDGILDIPNASALNSGSLSRMSLAFWFNRSVAGSNPTFVSRNGQFRAYLNYASSQVRLSLNISTGDGTTASGWSSPHIATLVPLGTWHHVLWVWDAGVGRCWLDGAELTVSQPATPPTVMRAETSALRLMATGAATQSSLLYGYLDEVALFMGAALDGPADIYPGTPNLSLVPGITSWWQLNGDLLDAVGDAHGGTLSSGTRLSFSSEVPA